MNVLFSFEIGYSENMGIQNRVTWQKRVTCTKVKLSISFLISGLSLSLIPPRLIINCVEAYAKSQHHMSSLNQAYAMCNAYPRLQCLGDAAKNIKH